MRDTSAPANQSGFKVRFTLLHEITRMVEVLDDKKAFAVVSVAAFAGLRLAELRGLRWEDYDGQSLTIRRAVWRTHVGDTKNTASAASVPVLPILKKVLDDYRTHVLSKGKFCSPHDYIFAGDRRGAPQNIANLARRAITPKLPNTAADNQGPAVKWKGWHAFRRALATNLHLCGVDPKVTQAILRHSDMKTTLEFYISVPDNETRAALAKIDAQVTET